MSTILLAVLSLLSWVTMPTNDEAPRPEDVRVIDLKMDVDGTEYAWSIMIPESAEEGGAALLFLHGAGECGTDGKKNLAVGLPKHVREHPDRWPFVVIVPQKPALESEWEDHAEAVLAMLDEAAEEGLYEPARLAITGLSQGGHGTIALASMYPERFRCAAPVCGYVDRRFSKEGDRLHEAGATEEDESVVAAAEVLKKMPVWLFHGTLDNVVPPEESRSLHEALKALDADVRYTEFDDANHNAWDPAYSKKELAQWFVEQTKE